MKKGFYYSLLAVDLQSQYGFSNFDGKPINSVSDVIGQLLPHAFQIAAVAVFFYFLIGSFKFVTSGGEKEKIAEGRKMITHALIGFVLLLALFTVLQFLFKVLGLVNFNFI